MCAPSRTRLPPAVSLAALLTVITASPHAAAMRTQDSISPASPATPTAAPATGTTSLQRGIAACSRGDWKTALHELEAAAKSSPQSAETLNWYGYALIRQNRAAEAISPLKRAGALAPKPDTLANLGSAYAHIGRTEQSVAAYRRAVALAPKDGQSWINLGIGLQRLGRSDEAADALHKGVSLRPQEASAWTLLGALEMQRGDIPLAISVLETARKLDPNSEAALLNLGLAYARVERFAEAAASYGAAADAKEKRSKQESVMPRYNQGVVLAKAGKLDEAAVAYNRVLAVEPKNYDALVNSGVILYRQGKADAAIARFTAATAVRPGATLAWTNLATAYEQRKDTVNAAAAWRKAASLEPKNYAYREYLAADLKQMGQFEALIGVYKEMADLRPTSAEPYNRIGLAYEAQADGMSQPAQRQAKLQRALAAFREAARRDPRSAAAYNNQGVAYERLGQAEQALAAYQQALRIDPSFADAKKNLARYVPSSPHPATATP
jgi:tetratricopeptide (TPR) repeat protein